MLFDDLPLFSHGDSPVRYVKKNRGNSVHIFILWKSPWNKQPGPALPTPSGRFKICSSSSSSWVLNVTCVLLLTALEFEARRPWDALGACKKSTVVYYIVERYESDRQVVNQEGWIAGRDGQNPRFCRSNSAFCCWWKPSNTSSSPLSHERHLQSCWWMCYPAMALSQNKVPF